MSSRRKWNWVQLELPVSMTECVLFFKFYVCGFRMCPFYRQPFCRPLWALCTGVNTLLRQAKPPCCYCRLHMSSVCLWFRKELECWSFVELNCWRSWAFNFATPYFVMRNCWSFMGQGMMNALNPIGSLARMGLQFECLCDGPPHWRRWRMHPLIFNVHHPFCQ